MSRLNKRKSLDDGEEDTHPAKRFAALKPKIHHVSQNAIRKKWTHLPDVAQEKVKELFRAAERPVLVNHRDERKKIEAQAAVEAVLKTYVRIQSQRTYIHDAVRLRVES